MNIDLKSLLGLDKINLPQAVADAVVKNKPEILNEQKDQWDHGLKSDGTSLGRYKNFKYKQRYEPIDLDLKGDFRSNLDLLAQSDNFQLIDEDEKTGFLTRRFGDKTIGLTDDNISSTAQLIKPDVINNLQEQLNGR